jgi:hypothetical protein
MLQRNGQINQFFLVKAIWVQLERQINYIKPKGILTIQVDRNVQVDKSIINSTKK